MGFLFHFAGKIDQVLNKLTCFQKNLVFLLLRGLGTLCEDIKNKRIKKIIVWVIFSVSVSFVPFLTAFFYKLYMNYDASLTSLFGHGELFVLSTTITSAAIGEFFYNGNIKRIRSIISIGICFLLLLISAFSYLLANISTSSPNEMVSNGSIVICLASIVSSGVCVFFGEGEE